MSTVTLQDELEELERLLSGARAPVRVAAATQADPSLRVADEDEDDDDLFGEDDLGFDDVDEDEADEDDVEEDLDDDYEEE